MKRIFISTSSYRDSDLINTIDDALMKAAIPERIGFGVVFQGTRNEFLEFLPKTSNKLVYIKHVEIEDSKGTGWARNLITKTMLDDEDYFLQIDSHTRFKENWDVELISFYESIGEECMVSAYPPHFGRNETYEVYSKRNLNNHAIVVGFTEMYSFKDTKGRIPEEDYEDSITAAGAFQFCSNVVAKSLTFEEYFNPWMDQEISSCLAYMGGYNIYAPKDAFIWHCYADNHIGSDEKWRPLIADDRIISDFDRYPFETIKTWKRNRSFEDWKNRVQEDINLIKDW